MRVGSPYFQMRDLCRREGVLQAQRAETAAASTDASMPVAGDAGEERTPARTVRAVSDAGRHRMLGEGADPVVPPPAETERTANTATPASQTHKTSVNRGVWIVSPN